MITLELFERDLCLFYCQMELWKEEMESLGLTLPAIEMNVSVIFTITTRYSIFSIKYFIMTTNRSCMCST